MAFKKVNTPVHLRFDFQGKVSFCRLVFSSIYLIQQMVITFYVVGLLLDSRNANVSRSWFMFSKRLQLSKDAPYSRVYRTR